MSDLQLILVAWATLPLNLLSWLLAWSRLPERVVMKTDASGKAIAWAARDAALGFSVKVQVGVLVFSTLVVFFAASRNSEKARQALYGLVFAASFVFVLMTWILWHYQVP